MKRTAIVLFLTLLLIFTGCVSVPKSDFTASVPEPVGSDEFAGKTFVSETGKFEFNTDGTVLYSTMNPDGSCEKSIVYAYSFDTEGGTLYFAKRGYYHEDKLYLSLDDFIDAAFSRRCDEKCLAEQRKCYETEKEIVSQYTYSFSGDKLTLTPRISKRLDGSEMAFVYSPDSTSDLFTFLIMWFGGGISSVSFDKVIDGEIVRCSTGANVFLTDVTDSTARVVYVEDHVLYGVLGYGTMTYKIEETSDTEGVLVVSFSDIDPSVIEKFEQDVASLKSTSEYSIYESEMKIGALISSGPIELRSVPGVEYTME